MSSPPAILHLGKISWFTNLALILSFHLPDAVLGPENGTRELIFQVKLFWKSGLTPCESQLESSPKIHLIFQPSSSFSWLLQKAPKYAYFSFPLLSTCTVKGSYITQFRQDTGDSPASLHRCSCHTASRVWAWHPSSSAFTVWKPNSLKLQQPIFMWFKYNWTMPNQILRDKKVIILEVLYKNIL